MSNEKASTRFVIKAVSLTGLAMWVSPPRFGEHRVFGPRESESPPLASKSSGNRSRPARFLRTRKIPERTSTAHPWHPRHQFLQKCRTSVAQLADWVLNRFLTNPVLTKFGETRRRETATKQGISSHPPIAVKPTAAALEIPHRRGAHAGSLSLHSHSPA